MSKTLRVFRGSVSRAIALATALGITAAACSDETALPLSPSAPSHASSPGTSALLAGVTADGAWYDRTDHDWTVSKSTEATAIEVGRGETEIVRYRLDAVRTEGARYDLHAANGEVCVTNDGSSPTQNLAIRIVVQTSPSGAGIWTNYYSEMASTANNPVLEAGEADCFPFDVSFPAQTGVDYRVIAEVTATNHEGSAPAPTAPFAIPGSPEVVRWDYFINIEDRVVCPTGFSCDPLGMTDYQGVTGGGFLDVEITNVSATCETTFQLVNNLTGVEEQSGETRTASASTLVSSGGCEGAEQCTYTNLHWLKWTGTHGHPDRVSPLLPIWIGTADGSMSFRVTTATKAREVLSLQVGQWYNGITILYAEILGVKLNIANGADGSEIAATLQEADALVARTSHQSWTRLRLRDKLKVAVLAVRLAGYNLGRSGPGICR
jgi:hypothetical protein